MRKDDYNSFGKNEPYLDRYVQDMVFAAAQKRLLETDMPLREISKQGGLLRSVLFFRRFRQRYGQPPSVYRKRLNTKGQPRLPFTKTP